MPTYEYILFQGTFAVLIACIVFGATAERVRYSAILMFLAIWSILVYTPMAHMVWAEGSFTSSPRSDSPTLTLRERPWFIYALV